MLTLLLVTCLIQGYQFDNREDIVAQYQPTLTEIAANFTTQHTTATTEMQILVTQIQSTLNGAITLADTQISTLGSTISSAKNICTNNTVAVNCLNIQESAIKGLSSASFNETCWEEDSYTDLTSATEYFQTLAQVADNTVSACGTLFPLTSEDGDFEVCIIDKIFDLNQEHQYLFDNFENVKDQALNSSVQCLAEQSAVFGGEISEINYQVTLCVALNNC